MKGRWTRLVQTYGPYFIPNANDITGLLPDNTHRNQAFQTTTSHIEALKAQQQKQAEEKNNGQGI